MRRARIGIVAFAFLLLVRPLTAAPPEVKDDAGFFSPAVVSQANQAIQDIKRLYKKDLHVETYKAVPAGQQAEFQQDKNKWFVGHARNRAGTLKIDGIFVHICMNPGHLEVLVNDATLKKAFPAADRDKVRDLLLARFKEKAFDQGLSGAVALARERFEKNIGTVYPGPVLNVVQDHARFFSPQAVAQTNLEIKEFKLRFKKDLLIETFAMPPPDKKNLLDGASPETKAKVFAGWLAERSQQAKGDGIHVLICKEPSHIQVGASEAIQQKAFTVKDRDALVGVLVAQFKTNNFDKGLSAALDHVYDTVDGNLAPALPAPVAGTLQDRGQLFSPQLQARANVELKSLRDDLGQEITIETFPRVPPGKVKQVEAMTPEARNQFFAGWIKERGQASKTDGLFLLICKQPARIEEGAAAPLKLLTQANRDDLRKVLTSQFQANQYEQGLRQGLDLLTVNVARSMGVLPMQDQAGFFKLATLAKAYRDLKDLRQKQLQDVRIDTFAGIPADKKEAYDKIEAGDDKGRDLFFADWQAERAKATGAPGIHILVCKEPARIQIAVAETTGKKFGPADRDLLRDLLVSRFKENATDKAVSEAVIFIRDTLPALSIRDDGKFFSAAAVDKGNASIRALRRKYGKDVLIETFKEVPPDRAKGVDLNDNAARSKLFADWAEDRQKSMGLDGINLLICQEPMTLRVATGPTTGTKSFTAEDRDQLVKTLIAQLRAKNYDAGLDDGLTFIDQALNKNINSVAVPAKKDTTIAQAKKETKKENKGAVAPISSSNAPPLAAIKSSGGFDPMWIVWGVLILLGVWIFIGILRGLFGGGRQPMPPPQQQQGAPYAGGRPPMAGQPGYGSAPPPAYGAPYGGYGAPPPQGGGGGGFMSGMLGGMFGAAAGSWLYDRFGRGGHHTTTVTNTSYGSSPSTVQRPGTPESTATPAAGYSSSGGDFGETPPAKPGYTSSGGDFGTPSQGQYASSGGDFGTPAKPGGDYASSGGNFGQPEQTASSSGGDFGTDTNAGSGSSAGGDWGNSQANQGGGSSAGGDWGNQPAEPTQTSAGGDWGSPAPAPEPNPSAGGDWGNAAAEPAQPSAGGDWGNAAAEPAQPSAGGDWGSPAPEPSPPSGGGDWSAPSDPGGGGGGGDWGGGGGTDTGSSGGSSDSSS